MKHKKFIWSTSTNAFQIEGARNLGGRSDSIWDEFTKKNFFIPPVGSTKREINSLEVAADFYHHYQNDAKIMHNASLNGFTYNLDWTRVFPNNSTEINEEGLQWTIDFFKTMVEQKVQPIPILFHWDTPMWAQKLGGWENREVIEWYRSYVAIMFKYLGKYTDLWFVSDENSSFTMGAYLNDYDPPQVGDKTAFVKAIHHLNMAGAVAKEEFEKAKKLGYVDQDALLGVDHDWSPPIVYDPNDVDDQKAVEQYNEWFLKFWLDPPLKGTYPDIFFSWIKANKINFEISETDLNYLKSHTLDFIGWNYYRPAYIASANKKFNDAELQKPSEFPFQTNFQILYPKKNVRYTAWNWIIDPSQLVVGAKVLANRYGQDIPIMIIENGIGAFDNKANKLILDTYRIEYLQEHIQAVLAAKNQGINLIGYSLWTYCDIFSPSGGYRKDYGIIAVDFNNPNRPRKPKLSYVWYKQVVESNGIDLSINLPLLEQNLEQELMKKDLFKG